MRVLTFEDALSVLKQVHAFIFEQRHALIFERGESFLNREKKFPINYSITSRIHYNDIALYMHHIKQPHRHSCHNCEQVLYILDRGRKRYTSQ